MSFCFKRERKESDTKSSFYIHRHVLKLFIS